MLVAANKTDILADRTLLEQLKAHVEGLGLPFSSSPPPPTRGWELMKAAAGGAGPGAAPPGAHLSIRHDDVCEALWKIIELLQLSLRRFP